jgi:hypothetical protein
MQKQINELSDQLEASKQQLVRSQIKIDQLRLKAIDNTKSLQTMYDQMNTITRDNCATEQ